MTYFVEFLLIWIFRLQDDPNKRPKSYEDILNWNCIKNLPAEPTPEEIQFIKNIFQLIPSVAQPIG